MMTSINPKNTNIANIYQSESNNVQSNINNIFQRNNYCLDKNMNPIPQNNIFNNISSRQNQELGGENVMQNINMNNYNLNMKNSPNLPNNNLNLNYNNQNNSINLNIGLQNKKNYSTPILNEIPNISNQERQKVDYNKSMDLYERNIPNKNMINLGQNQTTMQGNNEYYKDEIERLKKEIDNLRNNNEYLTNQLKEEQRKNEQLFNIQKAKDENENSILTEITHCLQISSYDEILPKLNEVINYLNDNVDHNSKKNKKIEGNNKIRDELISKLQNLYLSLTGSSEKKEEVTIIILWRWIKHLINTVKQLALEKEQNIETYQKLQEIDEYKEYCEELISEFNLQNLDELKLFMDNLLKQVNNENQPEMRNAPNMANNAGQQYQGQDQNYPPEEDNEEVEVEGEEANDEEGDNEGDGDGEVDNENMEQNQQQYENENEYEENNEMMEEQMMNDQNMPNDNYDFNKYQGN